MCYGAVQCLIVEISMASLKRSVRTHFGTQAEINGWRFKDEWAPAWPLKLVTVYPSQWSSILPPPGPVFQQGCGKASGAQFFQSSSKTYRTGLVGSVQPRLLDNRGDLAFASGQAAHSGRGLPQVATGDGAHRRPTGWVW